MTSIEISPAAFEAAGFMRSRISELQLDLRTREMPLAEKLKLKDEIKMTERDWRRLLGMDS